MQGIGLEIVGPHGSEPTMRMLEFARANRLPYTWEDAAPPGGGALPLVRLPGGGELHGPSAGQVLRALGIGLELAPREEVDLLIVGAGPAGLAAAVYGASEGLDTLVVESTALGGQAGSSRRIENYLGFPAGISGTELTSRAVTQARKFNARTATPYRALSLEPGNGRHLVRLEDDREIAARAVLLATGAQYRRLPVDRLAEFEGLTVFYAAGAPEAQLCAGSRVAVVGGGNSAGQAAVWLARGGALVTLLHRRADLRETMSDYLIHELERYGVAVRDRSEIAALHGEDGHLEAVTLTSGERLPFSFMFLFLGALPCTEWLDDTVGPRPRRLHSHRRRSEHGQPARDRHPRRVRGRRRPLRVDQTLRHRRRRRGNGRPVRPRPPRPHPRRRGSDVSNVVCTHLDQIAVRELPASVDGCEDCLRTGGKWLHLRICLICGHVACCDNSPNRHATAHAHATSHPIIRSLEPGEDWNWCYVDEVAFVVDGIRGKTRIPPSPTDVPGVFAAGDVRSGSTKRCATAVGEGAMAVQFVHTHLARTATAQEAR